MKYVLNNYDFNEDAEKPKEFAFEVRNRMADICECESAMIYEVANEWGINGF